ncbi:hypothetical protein D3C86_1335710 [compost metagenome]
MVVREIAVDFAEQRDDFAVQRFDQLRGDHAGRAVAAVDDHFQATGQLDVLDDFGGVAVEDLDLGDAALAAAQVVGLEAVVQGLDLFVGQGVAGNDDLEAVVVRRVVAAGEHHAGFAGQYVGGVVERRSRDQADITDVAAAVGDAFDQLRDQLRAGQTAIATDGHVWLALGQALGADGAADPVSGFGVQEFRDGAADVIGAEDAVRELGCDFGRGVHLWKCSISKVTGQAAGSFGGRFKLKGMTAFSTESSWYERAMTPLMAGV